MSSTSVRAIDLFINGEPGALVTVTETPEGNLNFRVRVIDVISSSADVADIADIRGLFFHVSDETLLSSLKVSGPDVTTYVSSADRVMTVEKDATMEGEVGKSAGPFDVGIAFGTSGSGKDDIRETSFTLSASEPLGLEFVLQQHFGLRLTSVSNNGEGRDLSLKLVGQMTGDPKIIGGTPTSPGDNPPSPPDNPPASPGDGGHADDPAPQPPETGSPESGVSNDDLIEGGDGNDTIYGGLGDDEMQGEGGDDLIIGGRDNGALTWVGGLRVKVGDNLYGNDGNDTFLYKKGDGVDLLWDFQPGRDVIKLAGYTLADIHAFTLVRSVENRIPTGDHDKIAIILDQGGDAILFNDYPAPSYDDVAIVLADGSTLSSARILELAKANPIDLAEGTATTASAGFAPNTGTAPAPLLLYGSNDGDTIIGGLGHDKLYGNEGINGLNGRSGNDSLYGGNTIDTIIGGEGDDTGFGNGGDDVVIGGAGSDKLYGAGGRDLIFGDDADAIDLPAVLTSYNLPMDGKKVSATLKVTKTWWGGFQAEITITARESVNAWEVFLKSRFKIESIWGAATTAEASWSNGVVYDLSNASWNGSLYAGQKTTIGFTARTGVNGVVDAAHIMAGLSITDSLSSPASGGNGVYRTLGNTMRGFAGADTLVGTSSNDIFYVDDRRDKVVETSKASSKDKVITFVSHTLEANIENMTASGSASVNLTGNSLSNIISGNTNKNIINGGSGYDTLSGGAGNDTLMGGSGNDRLLGGTGKDAFVFDTALNRRSNVDTINDFSVRDDTIRLENKYFSKLTKTGTLSKNFFTIGAKAKDKNDYIVYDSKTGALYYDADGSGKGAAVKFAQLTKNLKITYADFYVI
ncbi:calcium-binding protein [Microvirga makkahensis]|uniref:CBM2 domain-containing protein n=1 Tax=Microvirga makkahensis TaxID=1128670 RepID=A0A7X3SN46_9HYPH|nr:calcium-binding protein [Microvirga makkahensis]MXQ10803.1 hypothetical protein [Microvirga makkahensis]